MPCHSRTDNSVPLVPRVGKSGGSSASDARATPSRASPSRPNAAHVCWPPAGPPLAACDVVAGIAPVVGRDHRSASGALDDGTLVIYNLFHTADDARTNVVSSNVIAPDSDPCPPSGKPDVCRYTARTQRGAVKFSYTETAGLSLYFDPMESRRPTGDGLHRIRRTPVPGTLTADWGKAAAMRLYPARHELQHSRAAVHNRPTSWPTRTAEARHR